MSDAALASVLAFIPVMCGLIGTAVWKIFLYREQERTAKAEALRSAKNDELSAQRKDYQAQLRRVRTERNTYKTRAETAETRLQDCLERRAS